MIYFLLSTFSGALFGLLLAHVPYGRSVLTVFLIMTAVFSARYFFSARFRETDSSAVQLFFLIACWITVGVFYFRPTGIDTFLPPMKLEEVKLARVLDLWEGFNPNIEVECPEELLNREINIFTITRISFEEGMLILDKRLRTVHKYHVDTRGMSISRGPKVRISIIIKDITAIEDEDEEPYLYDAF